MRNLLDLSEFRRVDGKAIAHFSGVDPSIAGSFFVPSPIDRQHLHVVATSGDGWDHVSVSRTTRPPNWTEMDFVKRLFFRPDEVAMQLHVAERNHINVHPYCLHLWRPLIGSIPLPLPEMV